MGLFDRIVDDHVLMDLPELYKHSRQGEYFNLKLFLIYMIDGIYQVRLLTPAPGPVLTRFAVRHRLLLHPLRLLLAHGAF